MLMATRRRETSADSAARFIASRSRKPSPYRMTKLQMRRLPASAPVPRRITLDFAEPTLRAIYDALLEQLAGCTLGGNALCLTIIATDMVATALGEDTGDDPPMNDQEVE
jgi:hypothetical protein